MLILASQSPRRRDLLREAGFVFEVRPARVPEFPQPGEGPEHYVRRLAREKALAVASGTRDTVLGADTTVVLNGRILEKPNDLQDAAEMLRLLSGQVHEVLTGIALACEGRLVEDLARTRVWFRPLEEDEIQEYVASGEPMDKAGAYGIQGRASKFVERIDGCYFNVVGLPVSLVYRRLKEIAGPGR